LVSGLANYDTLRLLALAMAEAKLQKLTQGRIAAAY